MPLKPMSPRFQHFINRVLGTEGNYSNRNPKADPGGETKFGISKKSYPNLDIKNLTRDKAIEIYHRDFWSLIRGDELEDGVAYQLLDFAVNSGQTRAIMSLQKAVGVADDGHWGPVSQAALDKKSESDIIMLINSDRLNFMSRLSNWPDNSRGWARRVAENLRYGAEDSD